MCWAAIRGLNRLELAGESVRAALEALAAAAPDWLAAVIDELLAAGLRAADRPDLRLPASETARAQAGGAVRPGRLPPAGRGPCPGAPGWLRELPAVQALRRVWVQQYYRVTGEHGEKVIWREASEQGLPPGRAQLVSPYDTDARYRESSAARAGPGTRSISARPAARPPDDPARARAVPNLITSVATTARQPCPTW